jgi:hypothetical protein
MQTMTSNLPPPAEHMIFAGTATDLNQELRGYGDELCEKACIGLSCLREAVRDHTEDPSE